MESPPTFADGFWTGERSYVEFCRLEAGATMRMILSNIDRNSVGVNESEGSSET